MLTLPSKLTHFDPTILRRSKPHPAIHFAIPRRGGLARLWAQS